MTALRDLDVGDDVNLEIDLLARYTERLLAASDGGERSGELSADWLAAHGWS